MVRGLYTENSVCVLVITIAVTGIQMQIFSLFYALLIATHLK